MDSTRVMLITGTRKGIGRQLAQHYSNSGYRVIGCSRGEADLEVDNYEHFRLDVCDEKAVKSLFSNIRLRYCYLNVLINNAAIASMNHAMLTPLKTVEEVIRTNFTGTFLFCREAARLMQKRGGRIVNFTSVAVPLKLEGEAVYASSKAAVLTLTQVLARELAKFDITVNAIGPTPIMTDLIRAVPEEKLQALIRRQAIQRLGEFRDVANVIDFFIQPESSFVTGQVIFLGGV